MRLLVLSVGKIKEAGLRALVDDYFKRVGRHYPVAEIELDDDKPRQLVAAISKRVPPSAHVVALESTGSELSSEQFAHWFGRRLGEGKGTIVFLLGGADGLPDPVLKTARDVLSLSKMTFSHRLARLVLAEQLYRATAILHHEPYARI